MSKENSKYLSVGIDGCKGKWVAVALTESSFEVDKFDTIDEICERYSNADSIIIDMPIGLVDNNKEVRPERTARKYLKGKSSSIFNVPCREAVYSDSYEEACNKNKTALGISLSKQSYNVCSKIREVDEFLNNNSKWKNRLLEGHPEVCFAKLNDGKPVLENKTKIEGQKKRIEILSKYYKNTDKVVSNFLNDVKSRKKIDDVLDALCLSIHGRLGLENGFCGILENPMEDKNGIKMNMYYANIYSNTYIKKYNKLVRDKIPEIIEADNKECEIEIASKDEIYKLLEMKLQEEVNEFLEDKNLEELADVMEVLFGLAYALGYSEKELLDAREKKKNERGGFKEGIVLKTVREN